MGRQRFDMDGLEEARAAEMRQTASIVAIGLVRGERLERLVAFRLSMQITSSLSAARPWKSIGAMRPVSSTIFWQADAVSSTAAIASGCWRLLPLERQLRPA